MVVFERGALELRGNLHMHTTMSDGRKAPLDAIADYEAAGYDFLAITDHRRVTRVPEYQGRVVLVPGVEMDVEPSELEVIHLVGVGVGEGFMGEFQTGLSAQEYVDLARAHGGVCVLAHPHWSMMREATVLALRGLAGAEVFNSVSGPPYSPERRDSTHLLDLAAARGMLLPTVAADDTHFYGAELAKSWTVVQAERRDAAAVADALRAGRFYASQGPRFKRVTWDGDTVAVECEPVSRVLFHSDLTWAHGRVHEGEGLTHASYRPERDRGESFIRVILEDEQGRRAWLNPFSLVEA